jgi:D-proline reductase (dithiol) PrdB
MIDTGRSDRRDAARTQRPAPTLQLTRTDPGAVEGARVWCDAVLTGLCYTALREEPLVPSPVEYISRIREGYGRLGYPAYQWVVNEDAPPWQPVDKPLSECRLGLIASGGIYVTGQVAFHFRDDTSVRAIPTTVRTADLRTAHFAYDQTDARRDPNVVFPIDTLRRLVDERLIGSLTEHAYTFMGGIYSARRVRDEVAPRLTERLLAERADVALLVPV